MSTTLFASKYPLLSLNTRDEWDEARAIALWNKYSELLLANANTLPKGTLYLNSRLHDSWVTSIEHAGHNLNIWLNEFSTHCFADAFVETFKVQIPHRKRVFPICLRFTGIRYCSISWINRNEKMLPLQPRKYFQRLHSFLYDETTRLEDDLISMGIVFWNDGGCDRKKRELLLQVESTHLAIEEHQRRAFIELFGDEHIGIFDEFWRERQRGRYFDYTEALRFINSQQGNWSGANQQAAEEQQ